MWKWDFGREPKSAPLRRHDYEAEYLIHDVLMETAGTIDMDIEIKFRMG